MLKTLIFTLAALVVVLMSNFYVGRAEEPDPRILWVADSSIGIIDGFAVHPNGNIFAYRGNIIVEINCSDGKFLRNFTVPSESENIESIDISDDGRYLATSYNDVIIRDLTNEVSIKLAIGNLVTFVPNSTKIAYRARGGGTKGHDSSIVILDIETGERRYIKTEELIDKIAFSTDGRYLATGGTGMDFMGKNYTILKLWDANSLKLIKELAYFKNRADAPRKIQFSPDNKNVAFFGNIGINIYDTPTQAEVKNYTKSTFGSYITGFSWIDNNNYCILSKSISICRLSDNYRQDIYELPSWGFEVETDITNKKIISGTGNPYIGNSLISIDWKKILSRNNIETFILTIKPDYKNGILNITGYQTNGNRVNLEIYDINGKVIKQFDLQTLGSELRIPLVLIKGTYLLNLTDGTKKYSSKFMVTE